MSEKTESLEDFAASGILPMRISETGADHEPLLEAIICDSISGGADHQNSMPAELRLARRLHDRTQYEARYVQAPDAMEGQRSFKSELTSLLNRYSRENQSGTPDFILAQYLMSALDNLDQAICSRRDWYGGKDQTPAQTTDYAGQNRPE